MVVASWLPSFSHWSFSTRRRPLIGLRGQPEMKEASMAPSGAYSNSYVLLVVFLQFLASVQAGGLAIIPLSSGIKHQ
jgi:hypothetical protein